MLLTALDDLRDRAAGPPSGRGWSGWREAKPGRDPAQLSSEAMELAITGLQDHLRSASAKDDTASTALAGTTTRPSEASPPA